MTRHIIELNATRMHRVRMYARLHGAPVPGALEELSEDDQRHWLEAWRLHEATSYLAKRP
jgi:hypothetical protein